jgi:hypothetical protein
LLNRKWDLSEQFARMLNSQKLPTKFGSESSLEEGELQDEPKPTTNYTFDRKNYKKPDVISSMYSLHNNLSI